MPTSMRPSASLVNWLVRRRGQGNGGRTRGRILVGEVLLEATAPAAGKLVEKCVDVDQDVVAAQIVAWVEGDGDPDARN